MPFPAKIGIYKLSFHRSQLFSKKNMPKRSLRSCRCMCQKRSCFPQLVFSFNWHTFYKFVAKPLRTNIFVDWHKQGESYQREKLNQIVVIARKLLELHPHEVEKIAQNSTKLEKLAQNRSTIRTKLLIYNSGPIATNYGYFVLL